MQTPQQPARTKREPTSGYSLVELVVVVVLLSIVAGTAFFVILESMRVYSRTQPRIEASYETNLIAQRVMRDVRDIPSGDSIKSFGNTKLEFDTSSGSSVSYEYSDGVLLRNGQPLAENIQKLAFGYTSSFGTAAVTAADIHLVRLELRTVRGTENVPLALTIFPRGLQR